MAAVREGSFRSSHFHSTLRYPSEKALAIKLRPLPGYLMVETIDAETGAAVEGVAIMIDGEEIGTTPLRSHRIDPGVYKITLGDTGSYVGVREETEVTVKGGGADQTSRIGRPLWKP